MHGRYAAEMFMRNKILSQASLRSANYYLLPIKREKRYRIHFDRARDKVHNIQNSQNESFKMPALLTDQSNIIYIENNFIIWIDHKKLEIADRFDIQ